MTEVQSESVSVSRRTGVAARGRVGRIQLDVGTGRVPHLPIHRDLGTSNLFQGTLQRANELLEQATESAEKSANNKENIS